MAEKQLGKQIQEVAAPIARALGLDLVDVSCQGRGSGCVIRVTIDKCGGVGIHDCEQFHHSLIRAIDVVDPVPHAYQLEVSSPGLDRSLISQKDYQRVVGKLVRVRLREPVLGEWVFIGYLNGVMDWGIVIVPHRKKKNMPVEIPWDVISEAKLEIEF